MSDLIPVYVISLVSADDRREYITRNLTSFNVPFSFVNGTTPRDLPLYKQNSAIAIWDSHIKVMKDFLNTQAQFACVFEDDIDLEHHNLAKNKFFDNIYQIAMLIPQGYSILQLGTMSFRQRNLIFTLLRKFYFWLHGFYRFDAAPYRNLNSQLGKENYSNLSTALFGLLQFKSKPVEGFITGMQAYILNRSAAEYLVQNYLKKIDWDSSSRFSMDTFLERESQNVSVPSEIRTIRFSRQLFKQRPTPTSNTFFRVKEE